MKTLGYYNGVIDELDRMQVPMLDRACYFGDGVYDVSFSRNHKIYALEEHVSRFFHSADLLRMKPPMEEKELCSLLCDLAKRLDEDSLWVYFQLSRGTGFRSHAFPEQEKPNLWIMMRPMKIKDTYKPMRCITMEDTRFYHCNIKSLNLLPNVLATQATVEAGVEECILHRGETVTECAHSNLSILKDGVLLTHPADEMILAGTGRAHLLQTCRDFGISIREECYTLTDLKEADEIIITSASALCIPVSEVDGVPVGGKASDLLRKLQDHLLNLFLRETEA
ncbi:MAG: aminotransferase class IV [Clostridia bacterium]|nr:aminotransferase class IV [Clostridia bacterium]MBQ5834148.1 aminotransferase class IV [Clostridia bacterium]